MKEKEVDWTEVQCNICTTMIPKHKIICDDCKAREQQ